MQINQEAQKWLIYIASHQTKCLVSDITSQLLGNNSVGIHQVVSLFAYIMPMTY